MEGGRGSTETPAGKLATERLIAAVLDCDRYANGTHFIASDATDLVPMVAACLEDRESVALIYQDGRELLATPLLGRAGAAIAAAISRMRGGASGADAAGRVIIPPLYRVELREPEATRSA